MNGRGIEPDTRARSLDRFSADTFDACVIGGGITGAGVALELSARGCSVALIERGDFASGASSRSSKLVHGGLRYLARGELWLCREASRERDRLLRDAPHLVRPTRFLLPIRRDGRRGVAVRAGLAAYDALGGVAPQARHKTLTVADAMMLAPSLRPDALTAAYTFGDAVTDDANLVLAAIEQAVRRGTAVANYVRADQFLTARGRVRAVEAIDDRTGAVVRIRARAFVNAAGTSAGALAHGAGSGGLRLSPSKGAHLVLPGGRLPIAVAVVLRGPDGRDVFAVPRGNVILVGTTDTSYADDGPPSVEAADVEYLLAALDDAFDARIEPEDVVAAFAGLRPLLDSRSSCSADLSRRHRIHVGESGLVTIAGGKLTTFRKMAAEVADTILDMRPRQQAAGLGAPSRDTVERARILASCIGLEPGCVPRVLSIAGDRAPELLDLVCQDPALGEPLVAGLPPLAVEAVWAVRAKMALTLGDVLDRRLGLAQFDLEAGLGSRAVELLTGEWGGSRVEREVPTYLAAVRRERGFSPSGGPAQWRWPLASEAPSRRRLS